MVSAKMRLLLVLLALITGCGGGLNDLYPSGKDKSAALGKAPDFTLSDTLGNNVTLSSVIATPGVRGIVLYFTMWCPICKSDMDDIRSSLMPLYPDVRFFAIDYVSGSYIDAKNAAAANGFTGADFTILADTHQSVLALYHGTMGTTVVIDRNGDMLMNEEYKFTRLQSALAGLP